MKIGLRTLKNLVFIKIGSFLILFFLFPIFTFSQKPTVISPKSKPVQKTPPIPKPTNAETIEPPDMELQDDIPFEKSIEVDKGVIISLCVSEGNIKINGWKRDELRIFINEGSKAGFKIHNKNLENKASRLTILGFDPAKSKGKNESQCISGGQIELDVPVGANISNLSGVDGEVSVSIQSISKANVKINEGNIQMREISEKILAKTFDGDINIVDSNGNIDLDTTNGSILAFNLKPLEADDSLKAKTNNGSVLLQSCNHSIIDAASITGFIKFSGEIQSDGQYNFRNTNGQIVLEIPENSSCIFEILFEKNKFQSNNFKFVRYDISKASSSMQMVNAQLGQGEATISLQNQSGKIILLKRN